MKIQIKKLDQLLWSNRTPELTPAQFKSGVVATLNGEELRLVPCEKTPIPALRADRKSPAFKAYTAVKYGETVTLQIKG